MLCGGANWQFQLYWEGLYGTLPSFPIDPLRLEQKFIDEADPDKVVWLFGRAGSQATYRANMDEW